MNDVEVPYFFRDEDWYYYDEEEEIYKLTDKAPVLAMVSYEEYYADEDATFD